MANISWDSCKCGHQQTNVAKVVISEVRFRDPQPLMLQNPLQAMSLVLS